MRKTASLLIALAALFPVSGRAQTRAGVVTQGGLGVSASPVPALSATALQISPSALTAVTLSPAMITPAPAPSLVAPALAVAVQPAAAKPVVAAAKTSAGSDKSEKIVSAALGSLTSIKPAASTPDKQGSEQSLAAGNALFDGAARLSAPAIGDWFRGASKDGAKRASGLSPPTAPEIADAYREAKPESKAVETFGPQFVAVAAELVQKYTFMGEHFLENINPRAHGGEALRAAADLVDAHEARDSEPARRFMQLLGRWSAFGSHAEERLIAAKLAAMKAAGQEYQPHLPPSPIPNGEYWDMAAGMNAQGFIQRELDPNTNYSFFDYSPFVVSYLKTAAELAGKKNATIIEGDINALTKPAKPIAVLRTKNAVHYVPGFDKKLEEMSDWIAPGGQLIIQNDPGAGQRSLVVGKHGPLIRRLLAEGWAVEYGFSGYGGKWGGYALDTLVLTRPKKAAKPLAAAEVESRWKAYLAAVAKIDADYNPFAFLFR